MTEAPSPIKNEKLLQSIQTAKSASSEKNTIKMLNEVVRAKLLAPISLEKPPRMSGEDGQVVLEKDDVVSFEMIQSSNGDVYYPVFTDGAEMKKCSTEKDQHSLIVNFEDLARMVLEQEQMVKGFVIDPMGENICFTADMIKGMIHDMEE